MSAAAVPHTQYVREYTLNGTVIKVKQQQQVSENSQKDTVSAAPSLAALV